jgi:hypothetical protein
VSIKFGDGGEGGDATTDTDCRPLGYAEGGKGGKPSNRFRFTSSPGGGINVLGTFNMEPGNGGDGGAANAYGDDGDDGCPPEVGADAEAIGGEGGKVPRWGARARGNVTGLGNVVMGIAEGGTGGSAYAEAGDGGSSTCCDPHPDGENGGDATATGGRGGDSTFSGAPQGVGGGGARSGDGGWAWAEGGDGGNGASCEKEPGGNGGDGGTATATGGDPGDVTGTGNLTVGNTGAADAYGGDGGDGGDGWGPGSGGTGGGATADGQPATEVDGEDGDDGSITPIVLSDHVIPPYPSPTPGPLIPGDYTFPIYDRNAGMTQVGEIVNSLDSMGGTFLVNDYSPFGGPVVLQVSGPCAIYIDKSRTIEYIAQDKPWVGLEYSHYWTSCETGAVSVYLYNGLELVGAWDVPPNTAEEVVTETFMLPDIGPENPGMQWNVCIIETGFDCVTDIVEIVVIDP